MAAGKAIVASELGRVIEQSDHGRTAWLVLLTDTDARASAIHELAIARDLRKDTEIRARRPAQGDTWRQNSGHDMRAHQAVTEESC